LDLLRGFGSVGGFRWTVCFAVISWQQSVHPPRGRDEILRCGTGRKVKFKLALQADGNRQPRPVAINDDPRTETQVLFFSNP